MRAWPKRIFLFVTVNLLVVLTLSVLLQLLGVGSYLTGRGLSVEGLAIFCLVWGFGGAFISLAMSRLMAKWFMGVKVLNPQTSLSSDQRWLLETVHNLASQAGLRKLPQVGIYDSPEVNAFATGPTQSRALVAVSTGLLTRMKSGEIEGVLGHEITHIRNGDMVTMTLVQGVVNAFVMFLARIIAWAISSNFDRDKRFLVQFLVTITLEIALGVLGMMVVAYVSRAREFRADAGGARLAGREKMVAALSALENITAAVDNRQPSLATLKISQPRRGGLMALLATHPPLSVRIRRLQTANL